MIALILSSIIVASFIFGHYFGYNSATNENKELKEKFIQVSTALSELVFLKDIKDLDGKTEFYKKNKQRAWDFAKETLNKSKEKV